MCVLVVCFRPQLIDRLRAVCEGVVGSSDSSLLESLVEAWSDFKRKLIMIRDILMYMNKTHWSVRAMHDRHSTLSRLDELSLTQLLSSPFPCVMC